MYFINMPFWGKTQGYGGEGDKYEKLGGEFIGESFKSIYNDRGDITNRPPYRLFDSESLILRHYFLKHKDVNLGELHSVL